MIRIVAIRRRPLASPRSLRRGGNIALGLCALLGLAACGDSTDDPTGQGGAGAMSSGGQGAGGSGGFGEGDCRDDSDCTEPSQGCYYPGQVAGSDACLPPDPPCTVDEDCAGEGDGLICDKSPDTCGQDECIPGCTETSCAEGEQCGDDLRCAPLPCDEPSDCPTNFECTSSACLRLPCDSDDPCDGYCVEGSCYTTPGSCGELPG